MNRTDDLRLQRLPWPLRRKLLALLLSEQLFCVLYNPLREAEPAVGLAPEEVWMEACALVRRLGESPRPDLSINSETDALLQRYASFCDEEATTTRRTAEEAEQTRGAVLMVVLYMLSAKEGCRSDETLILLCPAIASMIRDIPLCQTLRAATRASEDKEEELGHFVPRRDYMKEEMPRLFSAHNADTAQVLNEIADTALESWNIGLIQSLGEVLSRYSDRHGHCCQAQVDRLRAAEKRLCEQLYSPKHQTIIEPGGTNISNSHFDGARIGLPPPNNTALLK